MYGRMHHHAIIGKDVGRSCWCQGAWPLAAAYARQIPAGVHLQPPVQLQ